MVIVAEESSSFLCHFYCNLSFTAAVKFLTNRERSLLHPKHIICFKGSVPDLFVCLHLFKERDLVLFKLLAVFKLIPSTFITFHFFTGMTLPYDNFYRAILSC